jgi:hypothetical protein
VKLNAHNLPDNCELPGRIRRKSAAVRAKYFTGISCRLHPAFIPGAHGRRTHTSDSIWNFGMTPKHLFFILAPLALTTACSRSQKYREVQPLGHGATYVLDTTYTPGFLDPSYQRDCSLQWAGGRQEVLPIWAWYCSTNKVRLEVTTDQVWLICDASLLVREGSPAVAKGAWRSWSFVPVPASNALHAFLDDYAKSTGDVGVHRRPYTTQKRIRENIVSSNEIGQMEALTTIVYEFKSAKASSYTCSPTRDGANYLPHKITSIDYVNCIVYCVSDHNVSSMPRHLVFSPDPQNNNLWRFDRPLTSRANAVTLAEPPR